MTADRECMYWHSNPDWYYKDEKGIYRIKDDAPERAKESYYKWLNN